MTRFQFAFAACAWRLTAAALLLCALGAAAAEPQPQVKPLFPVALEHPLPDAQKSFDEVRALILKNYYTQELTEDALYWAAIQGMLRYISPPESPELARIWTADQYGRVKNSLEGNQVSIGVRSTFNADDGSLTVTKVLQGSPAQGVIEPLDRILRINGQPLKGKPVDDVSALLDGPEDSSVTLTVNRDVKVFDVTVKRAKFAAHNLVVTQLNKGVALVELKQFSLDISKELGAELTKLAANGTKGLILDLRDDPGGVFMEALRCAELFLADKSIVLRTYNREEKLRSYVSSNKTPFSFRIVCLMNQHSASASEILAGALRDHQRASVVGTRSWGKGVFEKTFALANQFRVKFITGAMYTPAGHAWQGKGLAPDFLVEQDDKTLAALYRLPPQERYAKDVAMITAMKLLAAR